AASGSRKKLRIDTIPARPPNQRPMPPKCAASAATPTAAKTDAAAAWVPILLAMIEATARTRAAWIVQLVFSGLSVRDCANARDKRTNRPAPRATRIATVWRYGEARNPRAAEEPSPSGGPVGPPSNPVARANRPTMEAANAKAAIRPTFNRTGKATPYAREARALGSREADIVRPSLEYITGGRSKRAPVSFVTRIVPVPRSTASDRVTETCFGADGRIGALGEGVELTYWA